MSARNRRVGVIGTEGTIESQAYADAIHFLDKNIEIFGQACPLIVPLEDCAPAIHDIQQIVNTHTATYKNRLPQTEAPRLSCVPLVESLRFAVNPILSMTEMSFMAPLLPDPISRNASRGWPLCNSEQSRPEEQCLRLQNETFTCGS